MPTHKQSGPDGPKDGETQGPSKPIPFPLPGEQRGKGVKIPSAQEVAKQFLSAQEERLGTRSLSSQSTQEEKKGDFSIINSIYKFVKKYWIKLAAVAALAIVLPAAFAGINVVSEIYSFANAGLNMLTATSVGKALAIIPWHGSLIVGAGYLALRCALHGVKSVNLEYINNRLAGAGLVAGTFYGLTVVPLAVKTLALWAGIGLVGCFVTSAIVGGVGIEVSQRKEKHERTQIMNMNAQIKEELVSTLNLPKQLNAQISKALAQKGRIEGQLSEKRAELEKLNEVLGQEKDEEGIAVLEERIAVLNDELSVIADSIRENKQKLSEAYYSFFNGKLYSAIINSPSDFENLNTIQAAIKDFIGQCEDYPSKIKYTLELAFLLLKMNRTPEANNVLQDAKDLLNDYRIDLTTRKRTAVRTENRQESERIDEILTVGRYKELETVIAIFTECPQSVIPLFNSNVIQDAIREMSEGEEQESSEHEGNVRQAPDAQQILADLAQEDRQGAQQTTNAGPITILDYRKHLSFESCFSSLTMRVGKDGVLSTNPILDAGDKIHVDAEVVGKRDLMFVIKNVDTDQVVWYDPTDRKHAQKEKVRTLKGKLSVDIDTTDYSPGNYRLTMYTRTGIPLFRSYYTVSSMFFTIHSDDQSS